MAAKKEPKKDEIIQKTVMICTSGNRDHMEKDDIVYLDEQPAEFEVCEDCQIVTLEGKLVR